MQTSRKGIFWQACTINCQGGLGAARNWGYRARLPALSRSSRGLGHQPFTLAARVRIPYGTPLPLLSLCFKKFFEWPDTIPPLMGGAAGCRAFSTIEGGQTRRRMHAKQQRRLPPRPSKSAAETNQAVKRQDQQQKRDTRHRPGARRFFHHRDRARQSVAPWRTALREYQ